MQIVVLKKLWRKFPFDEKLTNRGSYLGKKYSKKVGKYCIPNSCVYHYHGIHQDNDHID